MKYETVSAFFAKIHFSHLLAEVQNSKQYMLTEHNEPLAMLVPLENIQRSPHSRKETIEALIKLGKKNTLEKSLTIQDLKNERRR